VSTAKIVAEVREQVRRNPDQADEHLLALLLACLTERETEVYDWSLGQAGEFSKGDAAAHFGVHENTAGTVLLALVHYGLLRRVERQMRGRPPIWLYQAK
jgi:predicted ArsR family transcriptional regulator